MTWNIFKWFKLIDDNNFIDLPNVSKDRPKCIDVTELITLRRQIL